MDGADGSIRLDKWLWQARFCKTRGLAAEMIAKGRVRVNARRVKKPATAIHIGDGLSFAQGETVRAIRVRGLGHRRGPATEARLLYEDLAPGPSAPAGLEPPCGPVK